MTPCAPSAPEAAVTPKTVRREASDPPPRRTLIGAGLASVLWPLLASPSRARPQTALPSPIMTGWREAVVIVPDLAPWIETLTTVGGWELAAKTEAHSELNVLWRLPPGARTREALMRNRGTLKGYIRLVAVSGADQRQIRPDDQAWETGGVSALDLRVLDIETTRAALHARGWRAPSDPVRYKAYGVEVLQWAPVSPDGVRLSFIQRIAPPLVGWDELKRWSRAANAAIVTADMAKARAVLGARLGLREASHADAVGGEGPNVMGLPFSLARSLPIDIRGYAGATDGESAIELISMPGAAGRDFSSAAHPPNLGIAALRVRVADAAEALARLRARGWTQPPAPTALLIEPYGRCEAFAIEAGDGVRLEFFGG
jgi:catechol 2,3-dioxygenase-like lactoylglutathione lyase family enzyme